MTAPHLLCARCLCQAWCAMIEDILLKKHMPAGVASKLAGKLGWTTQFLFRRIGRALLTPLYRQSHSRTGNMSDELKLALRWWLEVLKEGICEARLCT